MHVTVAICTWNRANLLDQTLTRLRDLRVPDGVTWDLLVVNNNCTDDTEAVIAKHTDRLPLRGLFEAKQGLSNARNCAIDAANGELLVWTDDDVLVDPEWLVGFVSAARRWPNAAYFGGAILPWYESPPPTWLTNNLRLFEGLLVIRNLDVDERPFRGNEKPYGANMAFRSSLFRRIRFNPSLGRCGLSAILGEETALFAELAGAGYMGLWVPSAKVRHFISSSRMTPKYVWSYFAGVGQTQLRLEGVPSGRPLWGAPRWLWRLYPELLCKYYLQRLFGRREWTLTLTKAAQVKGMIDECRARLGAKRAAYADQQAMSDSKCS
jgi:glycosyltransferase involved in cell wall biosynthesis